MTDPLLPYLILPYGEMRDVEHIQINYDQAKPNCFGTSTIEGTLIYEGQEFYDRTLKRTNYIQRKLFPSFELGSASLHDFGFGPKEIRDIFLKDVHRMQHKIQNNLIPRDKTVGSRGRDLVLRCIYRLTGYQDDLLFKVSDLYNQRIGIDLYRLACFSVNQETQNPVLKTHDKNMHLFRSNNGDICITGEIEGQIYDAIKGDFIPIKFKASGHFNLTKDLSTHTIKFLNSK